MAYIFPPETPTGVIDGSNTTFTTANNIYMISYITVDGVIYTGSVVYTSGSNSFTLGDAPTASLTVAYYDSAPSLPTGTFITVAECRAEFLKRKKDISDIDAISGTFMQWCNYINRYAYRLLIGLMPENYYKTQVYSIQPGLATYALPADFQDIIPQGAGLFQMNTDGTVTDVRLPITGYASGKTGFYMNSSTFTLTPVPDTAKQLTLRYIPLLVDLSNETDILRIPRRFSEHIMNVLDRCYNIWDEDPNAEMFNDERIFDSLDEMVQFIKPDGNIGQLPDFSQIYYQG